MANDVQVLKEPGADITFKATAGITGKRFIKVTADRTGGGVKGLGSDLASVYQMGPAVLGDRAIGVAAADTPNGGTGRCIRGSKIVTMTAGGVVAAGAQVSSDATGKAITQPGTAPNAALGVALTAGVADGDIEIALAV